MAIEVPLCIEESWMNKLPEYIEKNITLWFGFPKQEVDCQVATIGNHSPHLRTMKLYDITDEGHLVLITGTNTQKWKDLLLTPKVALCLLDLNYGQIIIEGSVSLNTQGNAAQAIESYWEDLPEFWKEIYFSYDENPDKSRNKIPDIFGVIFIQPQLCEILELEKENYLKSKRTQFQWSKGEWVERSLDPM